MSETPSASMLEEMEGDVRRGEEAASEKPPETLTDMVARAHSLTFQIEDLESTLSAAKKELEDLTRLRIPTELDRLGLPEVGMTVNNRKVRIVMDFAAFGSLSKAPDFEEAVDYLEARGFEGGVLTTVSAQFRRESRADADALATLIKERGQDALIEEDVNSSTLRAFVRQKFIDGEEFDPAKVGVTIVRKAKFTVR